MLAIIPARGGSKRLPGKNIKLLGNKPLIAYTIEAALQARSVTQVLVSTDDPDIAKISKDFGAIVPSLRPSNLALDTSSSNDVIKYSLNMMSKIYNNTYESCLLLQPTSPFRRDSHIEEAIKLFRDKNADAVISFCKETHPIAWNKYLNNDLSLENINLDKSRVSYFPNGAIYVLSKRVIESGQYYTNKTFGYIMDRNHSYDIDTLDDFQYCEYLLKRNDS